MCINILLIYPPERLSGIGVSGDNGASTRVTGAAGRMHVSGADNDDEEEEEDEYEEEDDDEEKEDPSASSSSSPYFDVCRAESSPSLSLLSASPSSSSCSTFQTSSLLRGKGKGALFFNPLITTSFVNYIFVIW